MFANPELQRCAEGDERANAALRKADRRRTCQWPRLVRRASSPINGA